VLRRAPGHEKFARTCGGPECASGRERDLDEPALDRNQRLERRVAGGARGRAPHASAALTGPGAVRCHRSRSTRFRQDDRLKQLRVPSKKMQNIHSD
jgi:hypothetical protein